MFRTIGFLYGAFAYLAFLGTFLYAMAFVSGYLAPISLSSPGPGLSWAAVGINIALLGLFAVQHTIMARPAFKRWWTRIVPASVERSTFVVATCICFACLFVGWQPIGGVIWDLRATAFAWALHAVAAAGWLTVLVATFQIDHFELFGLSQVWRLLRGRPAPEPRYVERGLYKHVRHPLMLGFLVAFWSTPYMTSGHLLFAVVVTGYVLIAIRIEERDLVRAHGSSYLDYRRRVPMLLPGLASGSRWRAAPSRELVGSASSHHRSANR